jgi:hypothetical protein
MNAIAETTHNPICVAAGQSAVEVAKAAAATLALPVAEDAKELALAIAVDDDSTLSYAAEELTKIAGAGKQLTALRMQYTKPLDEAKAEIMDLFRPAADMLGEAEGLLRKAVNGYQTKRAQEAATARAKAEALARTEREKTEREAREAAAELKRLAEAGAKPEELQQAAQAADAAQEVAEQAAIAPPPMLPATEAPKVSGISSRQVWKFEVTDLAALVKAAAERPELLGYLQPDEKAIGGTVRGMQARASIPGVRIYAEQTTAVRSRA